LKQGLQEEARAELEEGFEIALKLQALADIERFRSLLVDVR